MTILSLGIVRGLIGQVIGTALGIVGAVIIRTEMGLSVEVKEGAIIVGILVGAVGFLIGAGVFTDWFKWMLGMDTPMRHGPPEGKPSWTRYFGVDYSHKIIGIQYGHPVGRPSEPANQKDGNGAHRKEHRCLQADLATPHGSGPAEELNSSRYRDQHGSDHKGNSQTLKHP